MLEVFCLIFGIRSRTLQYVASHYASNIYSARFPHSQHLSLGLSTIQLFLKCENKRNLERGVFTPETKELQVRESCQLGGDRERARERAGEKNIFSPLQLNSALAGALALLPYFVAVTTRQREEREREMERQTERGGGGKKSADQLAWQQQRCNPTRHTLINAPSADGLLRINKKEASGHTAPPALHYHHHNLPFQFPPTHPPLLVTCQHTQLKKHKQKLNCTKNNKKTP